MRAIEGPEDIPEEMRKTLAGQAMLRLFATLSKLDTSFKVRLDEPITELDRSKALTDLATAMMNEIIDLWAMFENLARQLGFEEFVVRPKD